MLGVILDAIGVPAAAMQLVAPGCLVLAAVNGALEVLLGRGAAALRGTDAACLIPPAALAQWAGTDRAAPVDVDLGPLALPHRAIARRLAVPVEGADLLVTFLPLAAPQLDRPAGLGTADLGVTALEVLDMQAEMVSRWRPDGTILYCNEAFARQC